MLKTSIRKFVRQNIAPFDPSIAIGVYRAAVEAYIIAADKAFTKSHHKVFDVAEIRGRIGTTKIRIYQPSMSQGKYFPCIIYFTGSGFVYGNPAWQKRNCLDLCEQTQSVVINIEEKVAPEFKFPHGLNECFAVVKWIFQHARQINIDHSNISICGFSSGGNFAAVIAKLCMEQSLPLRGQYLISPWLDLRCVHDSYEQFAEGYLLDLPVCHWLRDQYLSSIEQSSNPDVSPLLYTEKLTNIAPCTIVVGECEPFRDECIEYARKLRSDGAMVKFHGAKGQIHEFAGCNRWQLVSEIDDPILMVAQDIREERASRLASLLLMNAKLLQTVIRSRQQHTKEDTEQDANKKPEPPYF